MTIAPKFRLSFFLPQYWLVWLAVFFLYSLSWLPFKWQLGLGRGLGRVLSRLAPKRRRIAERNLELCFPDMPLSERQALVTKNMENTGIAMLESGMAWWWPNWRVQKHMTIEGYEHIEQALAKGNGVLLLMAHFLHLEMAARVLGETHPAVGFYRPHNNPLMEYFQYHGRCRSNKYLIGKRDVKGLIRALNDNELCVYLPDQDYGRNRAEFVPFFAVAETATTTGTLLFASASRCQTIALVSFRNADNSGYTLRFLPAFNDFPSESPKADVTRVNQWVEQAVLNAPEQYMWLHRRFKTRADENAPSLYN